MRILQTHVDYIEYEPIKKELKSAEDVEMVKTRVENALVLFTSVEKGDDPSVGKKAIDEVNEFAGKIKCGRVLVYPFAHLSRDLSKPSEAMEVLEAMVKRSEELGLEVSRAPFGWNKAMEMKVKGHPMAEQSKVFSSGEAGGEKVSEAIKAEEKITSTWHILEPSGKLSAAGGFDFSGSANLKKFVGYEIEKVRAVHQMPSHITLMKKLEMVDNEPGSDPGNFKFLPKGRIVKALLEQWVTQKTVDYGAMEVETPIMYDYEHPALKEYLNRFPARQYVVTSAKKDFFLRFSACFGQFLLMADSNISYKDLPMRVYELTRYSFRLEKAGELAGLRRLRAFTMPDMHTLCSDMEMSKAEFGKQFDLCVECMEDLEIDEYEMAIRMTDEFWNGNKEFVLSLVKKIGRPILVEMWSSRFAYFDPKFEFNFVDSMGKAAALSTVQLDHENGKRFNVKYVGEDGSSKHPFILHASPSGAIERVMYALLEKADMDEKGGKVPSLPVWLSPVQVRVVPLSDKFIGHAEKIMKEIEDSGVRVDLDDRKEGVGKKVRSAELEWVPYIVVLGEREVESGKISLRERKSGKEEESTVKHLVDKLRKECEGKPFRSLSLPKKMSMRPTFGTV